MDAEARALLDLTRAFLRNEISPVAFERQYLQAFADLPPQDEETFQALDNLWGAVESYVDDPELRDGPEDLDEDGLRAAARQALTRLGEA